MATEPVKLTPTTGMITRKSPTLAEPISDDERSSDNSEMLPNANSSSPAMAWAGAAVWPLILSLPLTLSSPLSPTSYANLFPQSWYSYNPSTDSPKPLGLTLGILAVAVGQVFVLLFFGMYRSGILTNRSEPASIQRAGARPYDFSEGMATHLSQPEGFVLLVAYLSVTWMYDLMPKSYYSFEGTIQWPELAACLVLQDGVQYVMHRLEHVVSAELYKRSHKPHHRFTNPRLFDAFNGSLPDTIIMILIPLYITANVIRTCNVWTYMAFGSTYANWLTLIHSEYALPWDGIFRMLGMGTPGDHHVHHKFFKYNYGHLFMWFDMLAGTYRSPETFAPKIFNLGT
uniref:Fatty acid hydroxylase domain-containing protein n=1 Tax=Trieres chinensis TaxID=1514140 RepID=A0A7S2EFZ8_TRICV